MKMPSWLKKTKNDHEASTSRSVCRGRRAPFPPPAVLLRLLPPAPRPQDHVTRPARAVATRPRQERDRRYVPKEECETLCEANENVDHPDVSIPPD
jgi:hypothetical protein